LLLLVLVGAVVGCVPVGKPPLPSPDGTLTLHTSVETSRSDPTAYGCVVLAIRDRSGKVLHHENSHASDFHRWDIEWISNDEIKLTSSDIGPLTWKRQSDGAWKREED
jgi:hypothetical protein